ncbi:MAG: glutamine-hydrolyzing carbamoyl-phosphate synthase small subunit [Proteobacteria bacterium]|nr:glutamine-hydrolyzing carbamoyl-phosphate synthase small subunit [Pseudomonadota bacterium]
MKSWIILKDGTVFEGVSHNLPGKAFGEVVFYTGVVGFQETLTNPVYAGQILIFTYPLIGNYGVNDEDPESPRVWPRALIVRDLSPIYSNFRAQASFEQFLEKNRVVCIKDVDTRALTIHLREHGEMTGIVATDGSDPEKLKKELAQSASPYSQNLTAETGAREIQEEKTSGRHKIAIIDFGIQKSLLGQLRDLGASWLCYPPGSSPEKILEKNPSGILLSGGPGDPEKLPDAVKTIRSLLGKKPLLGIGLGHQLLALAGGARTFRMKLGHRGVNYPVVEIGNKQSLITSQHHSFCVDAQSLPRTMAVTHTHLNDKTIEGIAFTDQPALSIQFFPTRDEDYRPHPCLEKFIQMLGS